MLKILTGENGDGSLILFPAFTKTTTIKEIKHAFGLKNETSRILAKRAKADPAFAAALYGLYRSANTFFDGNERIDATRHWADAQWLVIAVARESLTTEELVAKIEKLPPRR